ncbi:MAG: hypothetical protein ICV85_05085 [Tolypothrix sp. T3-bin4]|nr:hypothetical protein [Tolypothrix sp. T3-bin4]
MNLSTGVFRKVDSIDHWSLPLSYHSSPLAKLSDRPHHLKHLYRELPSPSRGR